MNNLKTDNPVPIIKVRDLVASYGKKLVLDRISFDVYPGEIFVIIGASGGGKTTLLKLMAGLLKPDSGEISLWANNIIKMDEEELAGVLRKIGIAFQSGALFNSMSVARNVGLPLEEYGQMDDELKDILVRMKLSLVGLGDYGYLMPAQLSGGMKKRVGFARAIAMDPEIVFFDEPSSGLDPIMAAGMDRLILHIRRLTDSTMIVVTHELSSIHTVADRILMLDRGRVIFSGTVTEAEESSHPRVRQFFDRQPDKRIEPREVIA
jgi:phospholipid/cholesterol/gamma-HCH transport system ATP-binding protein